MTTSMVQGSPLKLMIRFALPLLIGNLLQQTYNIIDAAIVGQVLGAKALASVGASSSVQFLVLGFCMGCCTGFGVPVAKYFGAQKQDEMRNYIFNGAVLTAVIALIVTTVCAVLCSVILHILSVPEDIFADAYRYLLVIFLGIPFTLLYNYLSSILRSVGESRTPFLFLAFSAEYCAGSVLYCCIKVGLHGSRHRYDYGTGDQRIALPAVYYKTCRSAVAEKTGSGYSERCGKRTVADGTSDRTAVFNHSDRQYGHAVGKQQPGKCVCIRIYRRYADQAVYHVSI